MSEQPRPGEVVIRPQLEMDGRFTLIDHHGAQVSHHSFSGRHLLVFFGFTHCKKVCPRALARLERVLALLGDDFRSRVQPLYVTVDPARDTPGRMREFLVSYPSFIGLTGEPDKLARVRASYKVFAAKAEAGPDGYDVPHSAMTYLVTPNGSIVAHYLDALEDAVVAERLRRHL